MVASRSAVTSASTAGVAYCFGIAIALADGGVVKRQASGNAHD